MTDAPPAVPRLAATVLLVRDDPDLRVLMIQRHGAGDFADALVFPGGLVDPADADPCWRSLTVDHEAVPDAELALRVAAYRELFEETGLSPGLAGGQVKSDEAAPASPFADHLRQAGRRLLLDALHPFAHWVTPEAAARRFDTRFYLCAEEAAQELAFDTRETVGGRWIAPSQALEMGAAGQCKLVFPTRMNLALLARSRTAAEAVEAAKARTVVTVTPWREVRDDGAYMMIPPEAGYDISECPVGPHDALPKA